MVFRNTLLSSQWVLPFPPYPDYLYRWAPCLVVRPLTCRVAYNLNFAWVLTEGQKSALRALLLSALMGLGYKLYTARL